ncbi:alpha-galactosidase [Sphingomonas sp. CJ99]
MHRMPRRFSELGATCLPVARQTWKALLAIIDDLSRSYALRAFLLIMVALGWQTPGLARVSVADDGRSFRLDGGGITYALGVTGDGAVQHIYWGPALRTDDSLYVRPFPNLSGLDPTTSISPLEFPAWGSRIYTEPAVKIAWPDGVRDLVLRFRSHRIEGQEMVIELADIERPVTVSLFYRIDEETGIVTRSARIRNSGQVPFRIDHLAAAAWSLPQGDDYRLHYLTGRWGAEWQRQERPLTTGATVLESRRGVTGNQANPWFAVDHTGSGSETSGSVWFGALAWSGSWRIHVDRNPMGDVRIVGGFNPFDFGYRLQPGEVLASPAFHAGYTDKGMGEASRLLHRFQRRHVLADGTGAKPRPVLYNSWEATQFAVSVDQQMAIAERAARIGVERFVMDDGWFGARDSDKAGLGDWTANPAKFPKGLTPLITKVKALGMDFGLWVEPEMVNPDSDLYRAHPDWVIAMPGRPRTESRNQLVLNLAREDVRQHLLTVLDALVSQHDIAFLKWDHNRHWSEPGWLGAAPEDQQRLYVDYVHGLYWILAELRRRHPHLEIESCAGGGGRVDLGILRFAEGVWPSDNTDPFDRLFIQDGFTQAAHIRPVEAKGPDIVSNGLALSGTAHWMFDRGLIGLDDDMRIIVSRQANDPDSIRSVINASGRVLVPKREADRPHPNFVQWHRQHCFKH